MKIQDTAPLRSCKIIVKRYLKMSRNVFSMLMILVGLSIFSPANGNPKNTIQDAVTTLPAIFDIVIDQRPTEEDKEKTLSLAIWSCDYFVTRVSDKGMPFKRIDLLKNDIEIFQKQKTLDGSIFVKHYTLHVNSGLLEVDGAFAAAGFITTRKSRRGPKCSREKMKAGWFDVDELTSDYPPFIGELEVEYAGKKYNVRKVLSPSNGRGYSSKEERENHTFSNFLRAINSALIEQLK